MLLNIPKWPPIKPNITDTYFKMPRNKILLPIKQKRNQTRPDHCIYHRSTWYRLCKRLIQCSRGLAFDFSMTRLICFGLCEILSKDEKTLLSKNTTVFGLHVFRHYNIWHSFKYSSRDDYDFSLSFFVVDKISFFDSDCLCSISRWYHQNHQRCRVIFLFTVLLFWTQVFIAGFKWIFICSPNISCNFCV